MKGDWVECQSCWAEFNVISGCDDALRFCPYCGEEVDYSDDDEEEFEEDKDYDLDD